METASLIVKMSPELAAQLGEWSAPTRLRIVRVGDEYEIEARTNDAELSEETDRNARAYGWEIGRGQAFAPSLEASDDNPFRANNWRDAIS